MSDIKRCLYKGVTLILVILGCSSSLALTAHSIVSASTGSQQPATPINVFLPLVMNSYIPDSAIRTTYVPYFNDPNLMQDKFAEMGIFWFGKVNSTENYTDVRVGFNNTALYVYSATFDRFLWYNTNPQLPADLVKWDSVSLYLNTDANTPSAPTQNSYRFDAELNWYETPRTRWQAVYQGDGTKWNLVNIPFTTLSAWRGNGLNSSLDNRGWAMTFTIPFSSLGLSNRPADGTPWRIGMVVHDRDDAAGAPIADKIWPESFVSTSPYSWARLIYGNPPVYTPPAYNAPGTTVVRHKLNGAVVPDADVGGTMQNLCPGDPNFIWNLWGNQTNPYATGIIIQNQSNVDDWPCFAKYYITFPLDQIPAGKVIVSAKVVLYEWGGSDQELAVPSLIQVFTVKEDWNETTLSWNNAPMVLLPLSQTWVKVTGGVPWPGIPYEWDVSRGVADAYLTHTPLRLVFYEADSAFHSGKYFNSSNVDDWNEKGRPTLNITWGNPGQ